MQFPCKSLLPELRTLAVTGDRAQDRIKFFKSFRFARKTEFLNSIGQKPPFVLVHQLLSKAKNPWGIGLHENTDPMHKWMAKGLNPSEIGY